MMQFNHYRLVVTGTASGTHAAVAELVLRDGSATDLSATATATGNDDGSNPAGNAIDDNAATHWRSDASLPATLALALDSAAVALEYDVQAAATATDAPVAWRLEASTHGEHWYVVDRRAGQTFSDGESQTYTVTQYRIPGTVTVDGTPEARPVRAWMRATGEYIGQATSDGSDGTYEITAPNDDAVDVAAIDDYGDRWRDATAYTEGERVIPTNANGHWYEVDTGGAGASGATEPVWPTDGSTVTDNGVTWIDRGTLRAPVIEGPFIPVE